MEIEDIQRIAEQFSLAALRCQRGGFDGIELLSHSHLLGQFLGGSLNNRMRLSLQIIEAVRNAVGPDFIVGIRHTGDELAEGGLTADECVQVAKAINDTGAIDFLNVLAGAPYDDLGLATWVPPMGMPSAAHLTTARHAISEGHVDLVGMTRAHLADPHLVRKLTANNEHRIRPCVGLGYCVDRVNQGKDAVCGHNAATGREARMPHRVRSVRSQQKVVVIGAGPGGLEAARVSAVRGHHTVLYEASDRLGGQINLARRGTTRRQIGGIADWLVQEVKEAGVEIHLNKYMSAEQAIETSADLIVVATGGWPSDVNIPGGDLQAATCADVMARQGASVRMVTPDRALALDLGPTNSSVVLRDLAQNNVSFECLYELQRVELDGNRKSATLRHVLTGTTKTHVVDQIVYEHGTIPSDEIYYKLKDQSLNRGQLNQTSLIDGANPFVDVNPDGQYYLARIGDAVASRNIHAALYDALRVCCNFQTAN